MFEQAMLPGSGRGRRFWTTSLGVSGELLLLTFAVVAPMLWPQVLPGARNWVELYTPTAPPAVQHDHRAMPKTVRAAPAHSVATHGLTIPTRIPEKPVMLEDPPEGLAIAGVPGGMDGQPGGMPGGLISSVLDAPRPAPAIRVADPRPAPAAAKQTAKEIPRVRVGGLVDEATLLHRVEPLYPAIAKQARVSGTVELECVIGTDGRIREVTVKSGNPLLAPAAADAVRQWVYRPTRLNGEPVEVITSVTVTFRLGG